MCRVLKRKRAEPETTGRGAREGRLVRVLLWVMGALVALELK